MVVQSPRCTPARSALAPTTTTANTASDHRLDRTDRNFVHSASTTSTNLTCPPVVAESLAVMVVI
jgi:hypothetical protein